MSFSTTRLMSASSLFAAAVVGSLDPDGDSGTEFVSGRPALLVEHVLLQQRKERIRCGVVR
jgi:hypothetical protein